MTETPHPWDRLPTESSKSYAAFLSYIALGARRSVREAAGQFHVNTGATSRTKTTINTWLGWSAKHKWVSRANARDEWIARTSDEQVVANLTACKLALTTRSHAFLKASDGPDFLRAARALALHFPPVQRVEDVTYIPDLPKVSDDQLDRMRDIRDESPKKAEDES